MSINHVRNRIPQKKNIRTTFEYLPFTNTIQTFENNFRFPKKIGRKKNLKKIIHLPKQYSIEKKNETFVTKKITRTLLCLSIVFCLGNFFFRFNAPPSNWREEQQQQQHKKIIEIIELGKCVIKFLFNE